MNENREVGDFIAEHLGFNLGIAHQLICTHGLHNDSITDLKKAIFYINQEILRLEKKGKQRGS